MTELLIIYGLSLPVLIFVAGLLLILIDTIVIGDSTLIYFGIGAITTSPVIHVLGIENIYLIFLLFTISSFISFFLVKKFLAKKEEEDINKY